MAKRYGATRAEWDYFRRAVGDRDLLPVVSNPAARIAPDSTLKQLGKTPSRYNLAGLVAGIGQWTEKKPSEREVERWAAVLDYGICVQTRNLRALDVDIEDAEQATAVAQVISTFFRSRRRHRGTNKFLVAFFLDGTHPKRRLKTAHGFIEFLGDGQQFVAAGEHPSGERYRWDEKPAEFVRVDEATFEMCWAALEEHFAVEDSKGSKTSERAEVRSQVISNDLVAQWLDEHWVVHRVDRSGRMDITCPFQEEHTTGTEDDSSTSYFPANTGGFKGGAFVCQHAHCADRAQSDFRDAVGYVSDNDDFDLGGADIRAAGLPGVADDLVGSTPGEPDALVAEPTAKRTKYQLIQAGEFARRPPPTYWVQGILPQAGLAVLFGEAGSGKSFLAIDLALALVQGAEWRGLRSRQCAVVYLAAEGGGGVSLRLRAAGEYHGVELDKLPLYVLHETPNFMNKPDVQDVLDVVRTVPDVGVIIVDTFAQVTPGANENSGEDMGKALAHCRSLHRLTGALVVLVHHSGKDATKGARGWSGLRAAADAELEVTRNGDFRALTITKQKDGQDGQVFNFKLRNVELGETEDGTKLTSCAVEHSNGGTVMRKAPRGNKAFVYNIILQELGLTNSVMFEAAITAVVRETPHDPAAGGRDVRRQNAARDIRALAQQGYINLGGDNVITLPGDSQQPERKDDEQTADSFI